MSKYEITKKIEELNNMKNVTASTVAAKIAEIEEAVKLANASEKKAAISEIVVYGDPAIVLNNFLNYHPVKVYRSKLKEENGVYSIETTSTAVRFKSVCLAYKTEQKKSLTDAKYTHALYLYNTMCVRYVEQSVEATHNKPTLVAKKGDNSFDVFKNKPSINNLEKALNVLVGWMMPTLNIKMIKADVKYILAGFSKDKNGVVKCCTDSALENLIVDAIKTRLDGDKYVVVSKSKAYKKA